MRFAQCIPQGLLAIAMPVWMASQDTGAANIGSILAVIVLPWAFKLATGPLMDRYEFLPMGRCIMGTVTLIPLGHTNGHYPRNHNHGWKETDNSTEQVVSVGRYRGTYCLAKDCFWWFVSVTAASIQSFD
jgi:hypothetical protein